MTRWITLALTLAVVGSWTLAAAEETKPAAEPKPAAATETKADKSTAADKPATAKHAPEIQWQPSYEVALAKAKESGKPVMVDFYTDWCAPCKVFDAKTLTDPKVVDAAAKMLVVKVNAEEHADIAAIYNVHAYPTIIFLSPDGKPIHTVRGAAPPDLLLPDMKAVLRGKSPKDLARDLMEKGTDDPEEQLWIAEQLLDQNKPTEAIPWFEKAVAKLPDEQRLNAQRVLPALYALKGDKEKAEKAFTAYKNNPKANPEDVADAEVRFAYQLKDRKRMEAALDRVVEITKDDMKKKQIQSLKQNLDQLFREAPKPATDAKPAINAKPAAKPESTPVGNSKSADGDN